jgi:hypothetical protein
MTSRIDTVLGSDFLIILWLGWELIPTPPCCQLRVPTPICLTIDPLWHVQYTMFPVMTPFKYCYSRFKTCSREISTSYCASIYSAQLTKAQVTATWPPIAWQIRITCWSELCGIMIMNSGKRTQMAYQLLNVLHRKLMLTPKSFTIFWKRTLQNCHF